MSNIPLQTGCQAYDPQIATQYGYVPSLAAGVTFVTLFGISLSLHIAQATWTRMWWAYVRLQLFYVVPNSTDASSAFRRRGGHRSSRLGGPHLELELSLQQ